MQTKTKLKLFKEEGWRNRPFVPFFNKNLLEKFTSIELNNHMNVVWNSFNHHISPNINSVLDAGCGRGFFSFKLLEKYPNCKLLGVDESQKRINIINHLCKLLHENRITAKQMILSSKNVHEFPEVDLILYIAVHHQIYISEGEIEANKILHELWKKTKKQMIFCMADSREIGYERYKIGLEKFGTNYDEIKSNIFDLLQNLPDAQIQFIKDVEYFKNKKAPRMFFLVSKKQENINQ